MAALIAGLPSWVSGVGLVVCTIAAITDYRTGKIYNWLTLPFILFGLVLSGFLGWDVLQASLAGFGLASALFVPLFFLGVFGGGDVKLLMALGTILGATGILELTIVCLAVTSLGALALLIKHHRVRTFFQEIFRFLQSVFTPGLAIQWPKLSREIKAPFGPAVLIGFLYVIVRGV